MKCKKNILIKLNPSRGGGGKPRVLSQESRAAWKEESSSAFFVSSGRTDRKKEARFFSKEVQDVWE
jgi:hypothetical protein